MADNTPSYAANIVVRAFLTKFTAEQLDEVFGHRLSDGEYKRGPNKGVRKYGKDEWECIKEKFCFSCAYCGEPETPTQKLTVDHLEMFNRSQCGLQHPGNVVPSCSSCNSSRRKPGNSYSDWDEQLRKKSGNDYEDRKKDITKHIESYGKYNKYISSTKFDIDTIRKITQTLYDEVISAYDKAIDS